MPDSGLTEAEIMSLAHDYIGVDSAGYLQGFSYRKHEEFYARFCGISVDVASLRKTHGTTRATFLAILRDAAPDAQARIVEGTFAYLPLPGFPLEQRQAKEAAQHRLRSAVARIRGQSVAVDDIGSHSTAVDEAIKDAAILIRDRGNTSGVDRVHTALHGYLRALCRHHGVEAPDGADAAKLLKLLRSALPALRDTGPRQEDVTRMHQALATIVDAWNPIRNQASLAHPNDDLLHVPEAALVIDAANSVINYLNRKLC